jgi:quercetin dioxygenase-like cupin family protein
MRRVQRIALRATVLSAGLLLVGGLLSLAPSHRPAALPAFLRTAAAQAPAGSSDIQVTVLATRRLDEVPPGRRWVLRRGHPLNENAHAHAGGFVYAAMGPTYLVVEDSPGGLMQEGHAAWAPEGIGHLHTTAFRASNAARAEDEAGKEIWTLLLERETEARRPGAAALSPPLQGLVAGPHEARLEAQTFQPGAATALRRRTGPELAYMLDGSWELEYDGVPLALAAGQGYLADPAVPHRLRNVGSEPARLLSAQLVPAGQPAEES